MKTSTQNIKIYVVAAAIAILVISRFLYVYMNNNSHISPFYLVQEFKTISIKNEYNNFLKNANASATTLENVNLNYTQSIPVLVYHGIPYNNTNTSGELSISLENFKDQMFKLKSEGYNTITTEELYKALRKEIILPPKSILITFDDGRVDSFKMADPVLKALDYKATMFVIGRYSLLGERKKYYLSINQLKEMDRSGRWDIQAHSYDGHESYFIAPSIQEGHFFSHKQWIEKDQRLETDKEFEDRISNDFRKVKDGLSELLEKPINNLAFPYGDFGQNDSNFFDAERINTEQAQKFYSMVFYQTSPSQRFRNNYITDERANGNFFAIKRIDVNTKWDGSELISQLNKSTAKTLPFLDDFKKDNGWLLLWGEIVLGEGFLELRTEENETGGTILLDGSRLWKDYSVKATITSPNLTSTYIWVRFQDDNNNTACNFSNGFVHIIQTLNGVENIIRGVISPNIKIPNGDFEIAASVKGREIECFLNGKSIVKNTFVDERLSRGGVGFKTWDKEPNTASLIIKNITVNEI